MHDRLNKRLAALIRMQQEPKPERSDDVVARRLRTTMWEGGPRRDQPVLLRAHLILRSGRPISPLRALPRKGAAVQLQLLLLFSEQCRRPKNHVGAATRIPVGEPEHPGAPCWRTLVALPTQTRGGVARNTRIKQLDQLRNALDSLHDQGKIELAATAPRAAGRHDSFTVQNEQQLLAEAPMRYRIPVAAQEHVIKVPSTFFTNGWLHALTPDETIAYLFLLWLHQQRANSNEGMSIPNETWEQVFEKPRAHLEAYRMLFRMGLIRALRDDSRREDGTVPDGEEDFPVHRPYDEMTFYVDEERLCDDGVTAAITAVQRRRDGYGLDTAYYAYFVEGHG
ncbi:hypothetical protein AD006_32500 (plasmid) [Pseudonocardia sp. EC080610-09]|uniref:hypothetical protein n=1 Tax=Pseudonocardia sp. EC080610-09 TaxID=1688404 RepID=UPI000705AE41|nr:hypothetical protein [Pseudonocardia sp. EC080610-09]ALL79946.1 hypothetical protein AD006_32500 [Pseudonocardia sp. EC080610-09]